MTTAISPVTTVSAARPSRKVATGRFYDNAETPPQPLLWEKFGLYGRLGHMYDVKLFQTLISIGKEDTNGAALEVHIFDVVGCQLMKCKDPNDSAAYFIVYAYPERKAFGQPRRRERQTLTFAVNRFAYFDLNLEIANKWKAAILKLKSNHDQLPIDPAAFSSLSPRSRHSLAGRCLVLLNPFGGKGKALTLFTEQVAPVLSEAELQYNMIVTERPGHAQELIQSIALEEWSCVMICSGDGLIYEVINGLMRRFDWRRAIQIPIGVIPCGTGNALAASILWRSGESLKSAALVPSSAFIVTRQLVSPLDLILVETRASRFYSFLSICYGLIADVDIESEKYRKLGVVRNILGGLVRILDLRTYRCRISYLPSSSTSSATRGRAETTLDQKNKRRHVSDTVLKASGGGGGGDGAKKILKGRRRSATEAPVKFRLDTDEQTCQSMPNPQASANFPAPSPPYPASLTPDPSPPGDRTSQDPLVEDPMQPRFKHSMSVPNGFGVYFEGTRSDFSPTIDENDKIDTDDSAAARGLPRIYSNRSSSSGYASSSESPPDAKSVVILPGLEPIVEDDDDDDDGDDDDNDDDDFFEEAKEIEETEDLANGAEGALLVDGVIYDVPPKSPDRRRKLNPGEEVEGNRDNVSEEIYERIDLTPTRLAKIDEEVPKNWVTMETEIVSANVINISHLSSETVAYPGADINDGQIFIYTIRAGISKAGLLQMLASMDNPDTPVDNAFVDIIPCEAFRLEPLVEGILTVDGEVIPCTPIQGEVLPGIARVLVGNGK